MTHDGGWYPEWVDKPCLFVSGEGHPGFDFYEEGIGERKYGELLGRFEKSSEQEMLRLYPAAFGIYREDLVQVVAEFLSKICRFGGATSGFYSVLSHSMILSYILGEGKSARTALVHDLTEGFTGDIVRTFKNAQNSTTEGFLYRDVARCINAYVNEDRQVHLDIPSEVKQADTLLGDTECKVLNAAATFTGFRQSRQHLSALLLNEWSQADLHRIIREHSEMHPPFVYGKFMNAWRRGHVLLEDLTEKPVGPQ